MNNIVTLFWGTSCSSCENLALAVIMFDHLQKSETYKYKNHPIDGIYFIYLAINNNPHIRQIAIDISQNYLTIK